MPTLQKDTCPCYTGGLLAASRSIIITGVCEPRLMRQLPQATMSTHVNVGRVRIRSLTQQVSSSSLVNPQHLLLLRILSEVVYGPAKSSCTEPEASDVAAS